MSSCTFPHCGCPERERCEQPAEPIERYIALAEKCGAEVGRYEGRMVWMKFHRQSSVEAFAAGIVMSAALKPQQAREPTRPGPVTQAWTHAIPMMQQSVLLSAIRGPDGLAKYGGGAKMLLRWLRRCVVLSAMDGTVLTNPIDKNGGSFTGPSLEGDDDQDHWSDRMQVHVNDYLRQVDALPHHFQMHFLHAAEILGYKHPAPETRLFWHRLYLRLVNDFHLMPESEKEMDERLGDSRSGWLKRADPATAS